MATGQDEMTITCTITCKAPPPIAITRKEAMAEIKANMMRVLILIGADGDTIEEERRMFKSPDYDWQEALTWIREYP